ncbi:MAG: ATP-binding cassette domain-containing protein, partial [Pseudonocardiaceae bacterium]
MRTPGHDLTLRGVTFAYGPHAEPVLRNLDLTVPAGDHLAIVGPSGIGKSTLAGLLCGLRRPTSGTVQAGGEIAADLPPGRLAEIRTLIPQEAYVFAGTVWDNLTYLCSAATPRQLDNAVTALGAEALITRLGGVSAEVAPAELSAGERQLVALVRSFISAAPVVVLDEATCHLDPAAERRVEEAFAARRGTLIVIAHRVSSALRARRILVLDGRSAAVGDHLTLLATSPLYRELLGHWNVSPAAAKGDEHPVPARAMPSRAPVVVESVPFVPLPVEEPVGAAVGSDARQAFISNGNGNGNGAGSVGDVVSAAWWQRIRGPRGNGPEPEPVTADDAAEQAEPAPSVPAPAVPSVAVGGSDGPSRPWIFGRVTERGEAPLAGAMLTLTDLSGRQLDRDSSDSG